MSDPSKSKDPPDPPGPPRWQCISDNTAQGKLMPVRELAGILHNDLGLPQDHMKSLLLGQVGLARTAGRNDWLKECAKSVALFIDFDWVRQHVWAGFQPRPAARPRKSPGTANPRRPSTGASADAKPRAVKPNLDPRPSPGASSRSTPAKTKMSGPRPSTSGAPASAPGTKRVQGKGKGKPTGQPRIKVERVSPEPESSAPLPVRAVPFRIPKVSTLGGASAPPPGEFVSPVIGPRVVSAPPHRGCVVGQPTSPLMVVNPPRAPGWGNVRPTVVAPALPSAPSPSFPERKPTVSLPVGTNPRPVTTSMSVRPISGRRMTIDLPRQTSPGVVPPPVLETPQRESADILPMEVDLPFLAIPESPSSPEQGPSDSPIQIVVTVGPDSSRKTQPPGAAPAWPPGQSFRNDPGPPVQFGIPPGFKLVPIEAPSDAPYPLGVKKKKKRRKRSERQLRPEGVPAPNPPAQPRRIRDDLSPQTPSRSRKKRRRECGVTGCRVVTDRLRRHLFDVQVPYIFNEELTPTP